MDIDWNRLPSHWRAILVAILDAGVTLGSGDEVTLPDHGPTRALITAVIDRYELERDSMIAWTSEPPPLTIDDIPAWLLRQQRQVEVRS